MAIDNDMDERLRKVESAVNTLINIVSDKKKDISLFRKTLNFLKRNKKYVRVVYEVLITTAAILQAIIVFI